jgi:hypothetical protein
MCPILLGVDDAAQALLSDALGDEEAAFTTLSDN